jgi:hypothetical protein
MPRFSTPTSSEPALDDMGHAVEDRRRDRPHGVAVPRASARIAACVAGFDARARRQAELEALRLALDRASNARPPSERSCSDEHAPSPSRTISPSCSLGCTVRLWHDRPSAGGAASPRALVRRQTAASLEIHSRILGGSEN